MDVLEKTASEPVSLGCEDDKKAPGHFGPGCGWPGCEFCDASPRILVKPGASCTPSSGFWYSLFEGGYVDPDELLDKGADEVNAAIEGLRAFRSAREAADAIEEM